MNRNVDDRRRLTSIGPPAEAPHQRLGYLLVVAALHRAYSIIARARISEDTESQRTQQRVTTERRLAELDLASPPEHVATALTDAVVWSEESPLARRQLARLVAHYRRTCGLVTDLDADTLATDPDFDAEADHQRLDRAAREQQTRVAQQAAAALIAAAGLPAQDEARALRAVTDPREGKQRARLDSVLATAGMGKFDRQRVMFVLAYLSGSTAEVDLLTEAPVMVDARAELTGMLRREMQEARDPQRSDFFGPGEYLSGPWFEAGVLSLSEPDRRFARQLHDAVTHGGPMPDIPWPRQAHRAELQRLVWSYVVATRDVHRAAERLAVDPEAFTDRVLGQVNNLLDELNTTRIAIVEQIEHGEGLLGIERVRVRQVLDRFATGPAEMPGLLFVSERHKQARDLARYSHEADVLAQRAEWAIKQALDTAGITVLPMEPDNEVPGAISDIVGSSVQDHLYDLASGHDIYDDDTRGRISFTTAVQKLERALAEAGISQQQRRELHSTLDHLTVAAAELSTPLLTRRHAWQERIADLTCAAEPDMPSLHTDDPLIRRLFIETTPPQASTPGTAMAIDAVLPHGVERATARQLTAGDPSPPDAVERGASAHL
ncbi:hypothetical protein IU459_35370 [Nocardia amamiensis]|uniref:Uncharacterized protein n=1 Tax=Nocardia amamiensis TaxID=404578 RepID=A0ABS0D1R1_9NOCA|nr:hypothetical protein [Nocardia amamiensis]MBF6302776.1 hypothetical protein [Nocardia amamiensis]